MTIMHDVWCILFGLLGRSNIQHWSIHPITPRASVDRSYLLEKVSNSVLWWQVNHWKFLVDITI